MNAPLDVAIIGAGFAGIGAAIRLRQKGIDNIALFERDPSTPGGTWRDNTYPGAACDIPSQLYSYTFAPNPNWSRTYSGSAEILAYIDSMIGKFELKPLIRFGHTVTSLVFDETDGEWEITFAEEASVRARSVVLASGPLANASLPKIPGIETYEGHMIHSARWDHDYDFRGKKVAVVGTGASAVQIIPELVRTAGSVKVFQRTPGWVLPRVNGRTNAATKALFRTVPAAQRLTREAWFWGHESVALGVVWNTPLTRVVEAIAEAHLRIQVKDPWMRRQLTPDFRAGCKRLLMSSDYYPALQKKNCKLITWPIARMSPHGIRTAEGIEHQFDCIVFATGFDVSKTGTPIPITGRNGRLLGDEWSRGAFAYKSVSVAGYPNLFFTFGPNSGPGHNSALVYMESQIDYLTEAIGMIVDRKLRTLEVRRDRQDAYNARLQRRLTNTTWNSGCSSWYLTEDGFNATMFPGFATQFAKQLESVDVRDYVLEPIASVPNRADRPIGVT